MCNAGVATQGIADSLKTARHVMRTRRAQLMTSLHILTNTAYNAYQVKQHSDEGGKRP